MGQDDRPPDFDHLWTGDRDLQNAGPLEGRTRRPIPKQLALDGLEKRVPEPSNDKNVSLVHIDISQSLRRLYDETKDERIKTKALELIATEEDLKYRSK